MFRVVPARFRVGSGWFRVVPGGSGRFQVGSAFYIHPQKDKVNLKAIEEDEKVPQYDTHLDAHTLTQPTQS